jgi:hypothetical protein
VPSDLYRFDRPSQERPALVVAGKKTSLDVLASGYVQLKRKWITGDVIELNLPMPVRRVLASDAVAENRGRVALQRGPLVFCVEAVDHAGLRTDALVLPDEAALRAERRKDLLSDVVVITGNAAVAFEPAWSGVTAVRSQSIVAVPYYAWANRGAGYMDVWLARSAAQATPLPAATAAGEAVASASGKASDAQLAALHDGRFGPRSDHRPTPRLILPPQSVGTNWVQYEWSQPREFSRASVFWAVDRRQQAYWGPRIRGEDIVLPKSWRLLYQDGTEWRPVELQKDEAFTLRLDMPNEVRFKPVNTRALRLEVEPAGLPPAIQEWRVD